jgi:uncharacterized protein YlxW (UPF0749 family)
MKPFSTRLSVDNWVLPVSLLCLLLGVLMRLAWVTGQSRPSRFATLAPDIQTRVGLGTPDLQTEAENLSKEVSKLRDENTRDEQAMSHNGESTKALNDSLQDVKMFGGLTAVEGPGVVVTLKDSSKPVQSFVQDQIIHDGDVLRVDNELWNAGAEAISVNGHRIVMTTSIRCVGSTILVNNAPIASPVEISAIGDSKTLMGALNLPAGVLAEIRGIDPGMVTIDPVKVMTLPPFLGSTEHHFMELPKEK